MNTCEFGKFLSQLRKEKGLTQLQLAEKLCVTDKAVSRWETGKNYPDIEIFEDLAKILDISISELLEGKRIDSDMLLSASENQIVKQIKTGKQKKKKYRIAIIIILASALISGWLALKANGVFDGVIYNEIPCYSNDILTIMNNLDGYILQRPKAEGNFIIYNGFFFMEKDKTTNDILYLEGVCENGRAFYTNTLYSAENPEENYCFIGEFRENRESIRGIPFGDLKLVLAQLDLSLLPNYEKYELSICDIVAYSETDLNPNEYQKSIKKFIFTDGILQEYSKSFLSGQFLLLRISGFNNGYGSTVAYIYYKI